MAKPPKDGADDLPPINDDELAKAQARLQARIDQSQAKAKAAKDGAPAKTSGAKQSGPAAPRPSKSTKPTTPLRKSPQTPKSGVGLGTVLLCSVMAACLGGAIGWLGPHYFAKDMPDERAAQSAQMAKRLTSLEADVRAQGETLSQALSGFNAAKSDSGATDSLQEQIRVISAAVDERGEGLEQAALERAAITDRLDLTEAALGEKGAVAPTKILDRITALETRITQKPEAVSAPVYPEGADPAAWLERLNANEARIAALEARPDPVIAPIASAPAPAPTLSDNYDFAGNFPRAAMLAAVNKNEQRGAPKSWLQRQMDRHMQSGENQAEQARRDIARASDLVDRGNIKAAARILKSQSPDVQDAARAWLAAADTLD